MVELYESWVSRVGECCCQASECRKLEWIFGANAGCIGKGRVLRCRRKDRG